jgi:DNA-binding HxlR family transcriptional regulator
MNKQNQEHKGSDTNRRSPCPVANTLDILGDKWTLLLIRDLFMGKHTYGEFQQSPEGIPTNILADRLKRLEKHGIIERMLYNERPKRYAYHLTDKGKDLGNVLREMKDWGLKYIAGTNTSYLHE